MRALKVLVGLILHLLPELAMVLVWLAAIVLFLLLGLRCCAAPRDAVVRLISHGASATVIHTEPGRTLVLGCAHAFEGKDRYKPIVIDAPDPAPGALKRGGNRLLAVDYQADLSLVEMQVGPLPYVCPVAPAGHRPGQLLSVGYDQMRWPATARPATLLGSDAQHSYTREKPWHGRSGGALLDIASGTVVGVVSGYSEERRQLFAVEVTPQGRGIYVSHEAILRFLARPQGQDNPRLTPGRPWVSEHRELLSGPGPGSRGDCVPGGT